MKRNLAIELKRILVEKWLLSSPSLAGYPNLFPYALITY